MKSRERMGTNTAKPYKVQEDGGSRRIGVTAENMKELRKKAVLRLDISAEYRLCLEDGTEVDSEEYFKSLPPQTCFTFVSPEEGSLQSDLLQLQRLTQKIFNQFSERQTIVAEEVQDFLTSDDSEIVNRALLDYVSSLQSNIDLEFREEDELWFENLPKKFQTKEAVMKERAQCRIRNYYQKMKEYVEQNASSNTLSLVDTMRQTLRSNNFYGDYFVRSADKSVRISDKQGWFKCEGPYNQASCSEYHSINPYGSKEARIVFSTWNLDHVIEKSREVIPTFVDVAEGKRPKGLDVNWQYFYDLLFTKKNLKLVHIACHLKGVHSGKTCNKNEFYRAKGGEKSIGKLRRSKRRR